MLDPQLQLAQGVHVAMSPEEESILAVVPANNLINELLMLQSCALVVGLTFGEELERTTTVVVSKLKTELVESTSSLKATLEAMESFKEKMCQDNAGVEKAQQALRAKLEAEKAECAKE